MDRQAGVVARRQLLELGYTDAAIRRLVRGRELTRVYDGVYINHTGPLSWSSRAWAAVLFSWPAALTHDSAVNLAGNTIHVAIAKERTTLRLPGVRLHRITALQDRVAWNLSPPRVRFEDALLLACDTRDRRSDVLALVADACQRRRTTPGRLLAELEGRRRMRHRTWLRQVLADVAEGAHSVLESTYLRKVERAHGLPRGERQEDERTRDGRVYRDVRYRQLGLVIELDGRIGHELSADRWDDMDRDLLVAGNSVMTLRLGWRHSEQVPCRTAERLAVVMQARGWTGVPRRCGQDCSLSVGSQSPTG